MTSATELAKVPEVSTGDVGSVEHINAIRTLLNDYVLMKDANTNTLTGVLIISAAGPSRLIIETDAPTDEQQWRERATSGEYVFETRTDASGAGETIWSITRTGTAVDVFNFPNGELQYGGVEVETVSSTQRLKQNVEPAEVGLEAVLRLRPVTFEWNARALDRMQRRDDGSEFTVSSSVLAQKAADGKRAGLIAEEVERVIPEVVEHDSKGQVQRVSPVLMLGVLVKAIQELNAKIEALQAARG